MSGLQGLGLGYRVWASGSAISGSEGFGDLFIYIYFFFGGG